MTDPLRNPYADAKQAAERGGATNGKALLGLLEAAGLAAAAVIALSDDREWDENLGQYRDSRSRFA